uniref:WW domain-containing protein n=1 Tax=Pyrodinium bahamense TaxID=73915 RepID=A0A7S0ASP7_9DINO
MAAPAAAGASDPEAVLPPDAPAGHIAHLKVKFCESHQSPFASFRYLEDGGKHKVFRVTLGCAFTRSAAERIARACYVAMFDERKPFDEVLGFRDQCYRSLLVACGGVKPAPSASEPASTPSRSATSQAARTTEYSKFVAAVGKTEGCKACELGPAGRTHNDWCRQRRTAWKEGKGDLDKNPEAKEHVLQALRVRQAAADQVSPREYHKFIAEVGKTEGCNACECGPSGRTHSDFCRQRRAAWKEKLRLQEQAEPAKTSEVASAASRTDVLQAVPSASAGATESGAPTAPNDATNPPRAPAGAAEQPQPRGPPGSARSPGPVQLSGQPHAPGPNPVLLQRLTAKYEEVNGKKPEGERKDDPDWLLQKLNESGRADCRHGCVFCGVFCSNRDRLRLHKKECELKPEPRRDYVCEACGEGFTNRDLLREHNRSCEKRATLNGQPRRNRVLLPTVCQHCNMAFDNRRKLRGHFAVCKEAPKKSQPVERTAKRKRSRGEAAQNEQGKRTRADAPGAVVGSSSGDSDVLGPSSDSDSGSESSSSSSSASSDSGTGDAAAVGDRGSAAAVGSDVASAEGQSGTAAGTTSQGGSTWGGSTWGGSSGWWDRGAGWEDGWWGRESGALAADRSEATAAEASGSGPTAPAGAPLPPGWQEQFSNYYCIPFFYNIHTGESVWERPPM